MTITEGSERLAKALLLPINPALVIVLGIFTVVWGLWVIVPWSDAFAKAEVYSTLAHLAPEYFWGGFAIFCGLITCYGAVKRLYRPLVRGALASFFHWFIIFVMMVTADIGDPSGVTALVFAVYAGLVGLNIRVNFKDDKKNPKILH